MIIMWLIMIMMWLMPSVFAAVTSYRGASMLFPQAVHLILLRASHSCAFSSFVSVHLTAQLALEIYM